MPLKVLPKVMPLHVVLLDLDGYEPAEIAHIENVMSGELREREHRRFRQLEETLTSEEELEEETDRDLQTTERFELEKEIEKIAKEYEDLSVSVSLSSSFGFVSLSGNTEYSRGESSEVQEKVATDYAKELIERARTRIVSRTKRKKTVRSLDESEEINLHKFSSNEEHTRGIYRWVNKVYRAKRTTEGKRMSFDFSIPEPAAFYVHRLASEAADGEILEEPAKPRVPVAGSTRSAELVRPDQIDEDNYLFIAQSVGFEGVEPPPPPTLVVAHNISRELSHEQRWAFEDRELSVPDGYIASQGYFRLAFRHWKRLSSNGGWVPKPLPTEQPYLALQIGRNTVLDINSTFKTQDYDFGAGTFELDNEENYVPISAVGIGLDNLALNLEIEFRRKEETLTLWKIKTYELIMEAYKKKLIEYQEKLAAAQISGGVHIQGRNPKLNRRIEHTELRKQFLMLLTDTDFKFGDLVTHDETQPNPDNHPEMIRPYVPLTSTVLEFFEGAFDWANLTYEFQPYYWARKRKWIEILTYQDADPLFESFLRAGQARINVPVVPGYENDVLFYQLTGNVWPRFIGPAPVIPSDGHPTLEYLSGLLDELEEATGNASEEPDEEDRPITDSWNVTLPTELVWLQSSGDLTEPSE